MYKEIKWPSFKDERSCLPAFLAKSELLNELDKSVCAYIFLRLCNVYTLMETNNDLAERFCKCKSTISRCIAKLHKLDVITLAYDDDNTRYISSRINPTIDKEKFKEVAKSKQVEDLFGNSNLIERFRF
jgi:hypothetical protein